MPTGLYVVFAISMIANLYGTYLLIRLAERSIRDKDTINRLEDLCRHRTAHLDELKQIVLEMEEDYDHAIAQPSAIQPAKNHQSMQEDKVLHCSPEIPGGKRR